MALDEELDLPRPFGSYTLARRLAVGGMAEVYVGKQKGIGGFEKVVAIKVIHPRYSEDDHFIQMLVEEAKISVLLNHVNIAQTFDLGCIDETYYIVMELIEGADGYRVMRKAAEMKRAIPVDLAAYVAAEVCNGLDYAHRKRDGEGRPLGIVHRDVSPQNVLISYAGEVKVVDFGIAKAALRSNQTEAGVIKGKYYYMSPEQAWGDPMDHRSDIFSTGVVLYELLTGRMLYNEDNVPLLLDKVRKAEITPPDARRPSIPKSLSQICMRALAKDPRDRYQSAQDMGQDLTQFVYTTSPTFTASRLSELMGTLFPNEVQRHSAIVRLPSVEESLEPMPPSEPPPKSELFDLDEEDREDATRNDILPYRKRVTKTAEPAAPLARPTFRPPKMRSDASEELTVSGKGGNTGSDKITAPRVGTDGAWVSPIDAVTTNPRRASEDATDDTHAAAEWDDPTKLKEDNDWEDDHTLVDSDGIAQAMKALGVGDKAARTQQSERGRVNVQFTKQPARLGKSDAHNPIASAAGVEVRGAVPPRPASVRPPPPSAAARIQAVPALALPPASPQATPPAPPPPQGPPRASPASNQWPAPTPALAPAPQPRPAPAWPPASPGGQPSGSQPVAMVHGTSSSGGFLTPGHVVPSGAQPADPFAPPPPRSAGMTGGFEPVEGKGRGRAIGIVAAIVVLLLVAAVAAVLALGGAPPAGLEIISSPTGAHVTVDGRAIEGVTPLTVSEGIESGHTYQVEVAMPGHQPWAAQLMPTTGTLRQLVVLAPLPATLRVETDPVGAEVMVNGVSRGASPIEVSGLFVGQDVEVRAIVLGRAPVIRQVRIGEGTTTERLLIASP